MQVYNATLSNFGFKRLIFNIGIEHVQKLKPIGLSCQYLNAFQLSVPITSAKSHKRPNVSESSSPKHAVAKNSGWPAPCKKADGPLQNKP